MEPCTDAEALWFWLSGGTYVGTAQADNNRRNAIEIAKRTEAHPVMNGLGLMLSLVNAELKAFPHLTVGPQVSIGNGSHFPADGSESGEPRRELGAVGQKGTVGSTYKPP